MSAATVGGRLSVSVVVCAFTEQRWDDLTLALAGVREQGRPADQVVLVIDHNEALLRRARTAFAPGVTVLPNRLAPGLSGARNTGVGAAAGDLVVFLDDDAVPESDWLDHLVSPFSDPRVVAVGGAAVPRWDAGRPRWWPHEFDWVVGCSYRGLPAAGGEVRNVLGATMAFRADVLPSRDPFSPQVGRLGTTPSGCEETELCIRIRQGRPGARILFEPRAVVHHRVPAARGRFAYFARRTFAEGRSKATVAGLVGSRDALSTERSYVARTLPSGVAEGLSAAWRKGDASGAARAGAITAGLLLTSTGYGLGRARRVVRRRTTADGDGFVPITLLEIDLADTSGPEPPPGYERARILVRSRGRPVGVADVALQQGRLDPTDEERLRADFAPAVAQAGPVASAPTTAVSVVIATHNRTRELHRCLESLRATGYPDLQVIVVDNAPRSTATRDMLRRDHPTVTYVREDVAGLARAHNRGLEHVTSPVVAFTDDDVVVDRAWVASLAAHFAAERVGCVTGLIWPAELETLGQAMIESHGGFAKGLETRAFDLYDARPDDPLFPYAAGVLGSGANMAFRTEVLRALGGFDPALGAGSKGRGGDDLAAFLDVVEAGHTVVYEPAAIVHHHHRRETRDARAQALNYGIGLSAYLTRAVARRPATLTTFARLTPRAVVHLVAAPAARDPGAGQGRSRSLLAWQLLGVARGPYDYARSVRDTRRTPAASC